MESITSMKCQMEPGPKGPITEGGRFFGGYVWLQSARLRPPRCVFTGPVVVRLAEMANKRERERLQSAP